MDKYYLRVEAVNFNYFIYDTDKIQPMRGGSYLLLEAINDLANRKFNGINLNRVMTGASIGLFSFKLEAGVKHEDIASKVREYLLKETEGHATFVVSVLRSTGNFEQDIETITAMNRWQQFQQPTLVLPEEASREKCFYDGIRPGFEDNKHEGKKTLSKSVSFRRDRGQELRSKIYSRILCNKLTIEFTDNLEELSKNTDKGNLNGKMAFIYFDGNKFTKIRKALCKDEKSLKNFSECVESYRKQFLSKLIHKAQAEPDFKNNGAIRIETLLWGGDEFEIIVPAWKGWEVLQLFYESMANAQFNGVQLTHAGGIIFSNHKAPIRQIRDMARKLGDMAKDKLPSDFRSLTHNEHDIAHYLIMESFDTVGPDLEHFVKHYYGACYGDFVLTPVRVKKINTALTLMKSRGFPHKKVFEIIRVLKSGTFDPNKINKIFEKSLSEVEKGDDVRSAIKNAIDDNYDRWLMLADLWDFVGG